MKINSARAFGLRTAVALTVLITTVAIPAQADAVTPHVPTSPLGTDAQAWNYLDGFGSVNGVAADAWGNTYVADSSAGKIFEYDALGVKSRSISLSNVIAITLDEDGDIFAARSGIDHITKIAPDDTQSSFGGTFSQPAGVAVDGDGNVWVTDSTAHTLSKITPGTTAMVTWQAPASAGSSAITGYTVTADDAAHPGSGGQTCSAGGSATTCDVTGLVIGDTYTFTVTATNSAGTSAPSSATEEVTAAKDKQTITFTPAASANVGDVVNLTATPGGSGQPVTFSLGAGSTGCGLTGSTLTFTSLGTCVVDANQDGSASYLAADQVQASITVNPMAAIVTLHLSTSTISQDTEHSLVFTVTVTPSSGSAVPTGLFAVGRADLVGPTALVCFGTLSGGSGTCSPPSSGGLNPGSYSLIAAYSPDAGSPLLAISASSSQPLAVTPHVRAADVTLSVSSSTATYGGEHGVHLRAGVETIGGNATGTVTYSSGATTLCVATLTAAGTADCTLTSTQLKPGSYSVVATYSGDSLTKAESSDSTKLTVTKSASKTTLSMSAASVKTTKLPAETVKVTVKTTVGVTATGKVVVAAGKKTLCTITLKKGAGSCHPKAKSLGAGKYSLVAKYAGSAYVAASKSTGKPLAVKKSF